MSLPAAAYFVASSRLRPGLDGGYTVATMQRAADLAAAGADVTLLTFDPAPTAGVLRAFIDLGLATPATRYRNLFEELRDRPELLRAGELHPVDATNARSDDPRATLVTDRAGAPLLRLPFVEAVDWYRSSADVVVFAATGEVLGALRGFGELYRRWVDVVVAEARAAGAPDVVVISEARSLGELLGPHPRDYALVHTVHSAHPGPPYTWDSPMDALWTGWFEAVPSFDAVLWPTAAQRGDAIRRFGEGHGPASRWFVVPHPARPVVGGPARDPLLGMMLAGLRPLKRIDDAVRAWREVVRRVPGARLEILGEGPARPALEALIAELGLDGSVVLRGQVPAAATELARAGVLLLTSQYEGQSLAVVEALAAGTPVVSYDIPYGPAEMLGASGGGLLVPSGDVAALAEAIIGVLGDPAAAERMSAGGLAWAESHGVEASMSATAAAVRAALAVRRA